MRTCLVPVLMIVALAGGGCNIAAWLGYVLAPPAPTRTQQPEFEHLPDRHVAVVVYAGPETQTDFPLAQLEISDAVNYQLRENIDGITLVPPRRVMRYQDENPGWEEMGPEKLCKVFNCDYVLLVSLVEFATRESGSAHLVRGRLTAEAKLYGRPNGPRAGLQWRSEEHFRIVHPPGKELAAPTGNPNKIRFETERLFADALVKKFYKHKAPIEAD